MLENTEGAIKNGQSRETSKTKKNKGKHKNQTKPIKLVKIVNIKVLPKDDIVSNHIPRNISYSLYVCSEF
jgi:hypothetical protein